jgi:hypothetical protein
MLKAENDQTVSPGSILVEQNTFLPQPLGLESGITESGWARITDNPDRLQLQNCNCLEIDAIRAHTFLGVPWISLSAHSRHIQNGSLFISPAGISK